MVGCCPRMFSKLTPCVDVVGASVDETDERRRDKIGLLGFLRPAGALGGAQLFLDP